MCSLLDLWSSALFLRLLPALQLSTLQNLRVFPNRGFPIDFSFQKQTSSGALIIRFLPLVNSLLLVSMLSATAEAVETQVSEAGSFSRRAESCPKIVCCFREDNHSNVFELSGREKCTGKYWVFLMSRCKKKVFKIRGAFLRGIAKMYAYLWIQFGHEISWHIFPFFLFRRGLKILHKLVYSFIHRV